MLTTSVVLVGNLTRDPELSFTPSGIPVAKLSLAVNRRTQDEGGSWVDSPPQFYGATCWRDLASNVAESLTKGDRVIVAGRLDYQSWETDQGDRRSSVSITADAVGPDLTWATAEVTRVRRSAPEPEHAGEGQ